MPDALRRHIPMGRNGCRNQRGRTRNGTRGLGDKMLSDFYPHIVTTGDTVVGAIVSLTLCGLLLTGLYDMWRQHKQMDREDTL
jgi:hypothetical protein